jgi:hypothetical protein
LDTVAVRVYVPAVFIGVAGPEMAVTTGIGATAAFAFNLP